ncbi:MAG: translation initiation factor IF-3 [Elusimicrobia bacterium RIFOXYA2_FULL_39_19]|nr:MAG: translation initiation factor IF-3 [Elusimicrobia bacterium RIFOXYA2_FULL_39_19]
MKPGEPRVRINEYIRVPQVRVLSETGEQLGVNPTQEAIKLARESGKDLVEIVPTSNPPICKIIDFSKYKYEQNQKLKEQRKKNRQTQVIKEIRMRPVIGEHDLQFKINHAKDFLEKKHKVKFTVLFLGREMTHQDIGKELVVKIRETLKDIAAVDFEPKFEGNRLIVQFSPLKK